MVEPDLEADLKALFINEYVNVRPNFGGGKALFLEGLRDKEGGMRAFGLYAQALNYWKASEAGEIGNGW